MDAKNVRPWADLTLASLTSENTEVIGLNGTPSGHCGYSLPVVKHVPSGHCCVLSLTREPGPTWSHEDEVREMASLGRATLFPEPLRLPEGWRAEHGEQPVVVWLPEEAATHFHVERLYCAAQDRVEKTLAGVAARAIECFDRGLAAEHPNWDELSLVADVGLHAARMPEQRYQLYLRRCVTLPEKLARQLFRGAVKPTYRDVTWDRFQEEMLSLRSQRVQRAPTPKLKDVS